eukprot:403366388
MQNLQLDNPFAKSLDHRFIGQDRLTHSLQYQNISICPLTPFEQSNLQLECSPKHLTYSPGVDMSKSLQVYLSIPEYGFSSKLMSAKKQKRFVPNTPAKKNRSHASQELYSPFANILHFSEEQMPSSKRDNDIINTIGGQTQSGIQQNTQQQKRMKVTTIQLQKTNRFHTDFQLISKLGEGSFGEAFKVRSIEDGQLYAVKKAKDKYQGYRDREQKLLEVHRALKLTKLGQETKKQNADQVKYSDSCVQVYEAWEESGYLYIRSELCEKGNLNDYLVELEKLQENELLKEDDIWRFLYQMACAIKHVHDSGFIHLDIKPSNFFVMSNGNIKLGDFGQAVELCNLAKIRDDDVEGDSVYMAPELLKSNIKVTDRITKKADIFSLGASLLELASGMNLPQNGMMWQKLRQGDLIQFSPSAGRSQQIESLINLMMDPCPESRPDIDDILLHPKLTNIQASMNPSIKRSLKLNHLESPIVDKLRNPLSTKNKSQVELILISPRILKSASKQIQYQKVTKNQNSSDYSGELYDQVKEDYGDDDYNFHSNDLAENLRTVGRSGSFMEDQNDNYKNLNQYSNQQQHQSTAHTNKHDYQQAGGDHASLYKSAKKLRFEMADQKNKKFDQISYNDVIPFKAEGTEQGVVNYTNFLNSKNLNNLFETVDEIMTEEDHESKSVSIQSSGNHSSGYIGNNPQNIFQAVHISQLKLNEMNSSKPFSFNENFNSMNAYSNNPEQNQYLQITPHLQGKASMLSNMSRTSSNSNSGGFQLRSSNDNNKRRKRAEISSNSFGLSHNHQQNINNHQSCNTTAHPKNRNSTNPFETNVNCFSLGGSAKKRLFSNNPFTKQDHSAQQASPSVESWQQMIVEEDQQIQSNLPDSILDNNNCESDFEINRHSNFSSNNINMDQLTMLRQQPIVLSNFSQLGQDIKRNLFDA